MFYLMSVDTPEDEAFIVSLYSKYEQMMFRIAYNILKDNYYAEDAVQEVFLNIIRLNSFSKLKKLRPVQTKAYLIVCAKNSALKYFNERKKQAAEDIEDTSFFKSGASAEEEIFSEYNLETLKKSLLKLSPDDYELLYQISVLDYSVSDISEKMGISVNAVRQRLFRARERLKKILKEEDTVNDRQ